MLSAARRRVQRRMRSRIAGAAHPLSPTVPPAASPAPTSAVAAGGCRANLEKA